MTGMGAIMAAGGPYGGGSPPPPSLSITMSNSGGSPVNVSGASGSSAIFGYNVSGGVPPYTVSAGASNMGPNPSGKLGQGNPSAPNSATGTFTLTWTGYAVNETESAYFGCSVIDSASTFRSATIANLSVKRTS